MSFWKRLKLGFMLSVRWEFLYREWKYGNVADRMEAAVKNDPGLARFVGELEAAFNDTKQLF